MTRATRYSLAVALLLVMVLTATAASIGLSEWVVTRSQHEWCTTLRLLTDNPVPYPSDPSKNVSRVEDYRLYQDFLAVRDEFGC